MPIYPHQVELITDSSGVLLISSGQLITTLTFLALFAYLTRRCSPSLAFHIFLKGVAMGSQSANINDLASEHTFKASCNMVKRS